MTYIDTLIIPEVTDDVQETEQKFCHLRYTGCPSLLAICRVFKPYGHGEPLPHGKHPKTCSVCALPYCPACINRPPLFGHQVCPCCNHPVWDSHNL